MATDEKVKKRSKQETQEFLETAFARFKQAEEAEREIRKEALDDLKFRAGDQWPDEIKRQRDQDNRPCLTVNKLPQFIRQITNDQRQNRPAIKVSPVDSGADVDTAKILQGIIRHIEYDSDADTAYDSAFEGAVTKGFGYFRVISEFEGPMSFNKQLKIQKVRDDFSVYLDPFYIQPDGRDINWGFIFEDLPHEDYKMIYPNSEMTGSLVDKRGFGDSEKDWINSEYVRVAEYYYKEFIEKEIILYESDSGPIVMQMDQVKTPDGFIEGFDPEKVLKRRTAQVPVVKWCKINAFEILEETDWAGQWIPIIPVLGDWLEVDGKKKLEGIVRHSKDSQRMYNYWSSAETEAIALAPRAPFIGVEGQFKGHEDKWRTANTKNHAYLEYKNVSLTDTPTPPPQRNTFEPAVMAITNAKLGSSDDMKSTTGIYDPSLGNRSNETSGIAINARVAQAQTSNFHFTDNLSRALKHTGRILIDLIPKIYDTERTIRIIGEDNSEEIVTINRVVDDEEKENSTSLGFGKYDITVSTGPSFATKRQEAVQTMLDFIKVYPPAAQLISDLIVKNIDFHGSDEIAERLKTILPPDILAQEGKNGKEKVPVHIQRQLAQMSQLIEQLTQQLNAKSEALEGEVVKAQMDKYKIDTDRDMKAAKIEADMRIAQMKEQGLDDRFAFDQEIRQLDQMQSNYQLKQNQSGNPPQESQQSNQNNFQAFEG